MPREAGGGGMTQAECANVLQRGAGITVLLRLVMQASGQLVHERYKNKHMLQARTS